MMNHQKRVQALIAFRQIKGLGRKKRLEIFEMMHANQDTMYFEMLAAALKMRGISAMMPIGDFVQAWEKAGEIIDCCVKEGIEIKTIFEEDFPEVLRFEDGPDLIYYQGDLSVLNHVDRAAVIGTRAPSESGRKHAYRWGAQLAELGYTVISGLAAGCDTAAHQGCIDRGGKTVAFLPSALNQIVPKENRALADEIVATGGCLISEYSPLETVSAYMFIERDRLQAETANFIVTSEFADGSGTLHTLNDGHDLGRSIYTSPEIVRNSADGFRLLTGSGIPYQVMEEGTSQEVFKELKVKNV